MIPTFLRPEVFPYASIEIVPAVSAVERTIEDAERVRFHAFLIDPATGPMLDVLLADCAAADAAIEAERNEDRGDEDRGSQCGAACGYCGGCS